MEKRITAENNSEVTAGQKRIMKLLKQKRRKEAFIYLLNHCKQDMLTEVLEEILIEEFYLPHAERCQKCYEKNRMILEKYPYFKHELGKDILALDFLILQCEEEYYKFNSQDKQVEKLLFPHPKDTIENKTEAGTVIFLKNYFHFKKIFKIEIENRKVDLIFPWMKVPLYLYYDSIDLLLPYLQCFDFSFLLKSERIVFLFSQEEISNWFQNLQVKFPEIYPGLAETDAIVRDIKLIAQAREDAYGVNLQETKEYYNSLSKKYLYDSLQSGKPRIVFFSSLMSTATQYFIRDLAKACDRIQIPNRIMIEHDNLFRVTTGYIFQVLNEFRPDIFLMIDDFRFQRDFIPSNMIYFNWVQDAYDQVLDYDSAGKTTELDFILNLWITNKEILLKRGHPEDRIIEGPIIVPDAEIYQEYTLTETDQEEYGCDICLFSNAGNPKEGLENMLTLIKDSLHIEKLKKLITAAYEELYRKFDNEAWIFSDEEYKEFLDSYYTEYGLSVSETEKEKITHKFRELVAWQIMRSLPLEWLHKKGYDMKIWGRAWLDHPTLNKYAQGVAENGEKLAKIIKASKIVLGTNPTVTGHPRVFETFLSGGFYLGINIPSEQDWVNIRRYMLEDEEIVFFYSKEDLYRKVDYYLENEAKRKEIINNAQKKMKNEINYEILFPRALAEAAQKFARQINIEQENEVR